MFERLTQSFLKFLKLERVLGSSELLKPVKGKKIGLGVLPRIHGC
jgi:hypothetical protein